MRISDWSSDVCSSDLANSPVDAVLPTQELADLLVGTGEELLGEFAHLDSCDVVDRLLDAADDRRVAHQNTFDEVARLLRLAQDKARDPAARFECIVDPELGALIVEYLLILLGTDLRSEERRVGNECVSTCT